MKVLWFNHRDPKHPQAGGAEVRIREVGKRLVRMGCSVKLICERWDGSQAVEFLDGIEVVRAAGKYGLHLMVPFLLNDGSDFDVVIDDVAHAVPWFSPLFTTKPVVGQVHHVHQRVLSVELSPLLAEFAALSEGSLKYFYKTLVTVSDSTKRDLVSRFGIPDAKIKVVPNGVDLELYRPVGDKFSVPTVLWVGRVKRYKRVDDVLRAFSIVKEKVPDCRLFVVGSGDFLPALKRTSAQLGLSGKVAFAGRVSEEEKVRFMGSSWVAVGSSMVEGWGMTLTECAACGTPAVAYDVTGLRDSVKDGETGLLAESGDVEDLAEKLLFVLEDKKLRIRLRRNALEYSQHFSWDKTAEEFIKILETVVNEG